MKEQNADPQGGQGDSPVLWFCIMTSTLNRTHQILNLFYLWFSGLYLRKEGKKKRLGVFPSVHREHRITIKFTWITHINFLSLYFYYISYLGVMTNAFNPRALRQEEAQSLTLQPGKASS